MAQAFQLQIVRYHQIKCLNETPFSRCPLPARTESNIYSCTQVVVNLSTRIMFSLTMELIKILTLLIHKKGKTNTSKKN